MHRRSNVLLWLKNHIPNRRRIIQLYCALLYNANIKGFISGQIYKGNSKYLCLPGFNCYSCPGAIGACPLGSLQNALAGSKTKTPFFVLGILGLFGLSFGRWVCGFLCPVGLFQELVYKIKTPKVRKSKITRILSYSKYLFLLLFVVLMTLAYGFQNVALPAFCKYICPVGTFEGAVLLLGNKNNADLFAQLGPLFTWKFSLMVIIMIASIFIFRFFCRFICPLGAIYSLFSRIALLGVKVDENACTNCGKCISTCKVDIKHVGDHECVQCGECIPVCPTKAISWKGQKLVLAPNEINTIKALEEPSEVEKEIFETPKKVKKKSKWNPKAFTISLTALGVVTLVGAIVYYNFIDVEKVKANDEYRIYDIGEICPDFEYQVYGSDTTFKASQYRGNILVINFWATWCTPCVGELPYLQQINDTYSNVDVVCFHSTDVTDDVDNYINTNLSSYTIPFIKDEINEEYNFDLYKMLGGTTYMPYTVIINKDGVIDSKHIKAIKNEDDFNEFNSYIAELSSK